MILLIGSVTCSGPKSGCAVLASHRPDLLPAFPATCFRQLPPGCWSPGPLYLLPIVCPPDLAFAHLAFAQLAFAQLAFARLAFAQLAFAQLAFAQREQLFSSVSSSSAA